MFFIGKYIILEWKNMCKQVFGVGFPFVRAFSAAALLPAIKNSHFFQ